MAKVAVVIRQLTSHRPVTSAVIEESWIPDSERQQVDDINHYLISRAKQHIRSMVQQFVEFKDAKWYVDIVNNISEDVEYSEELDIADIL